MIVREVPTEIVIEATYSIMLPFAFSLSARKVAAKIALASIAYELGCPFALAPQFDFLRGARTASRLAPSMSLQVINKIGAGRMDSNHLRQVVPDGLPEGTRFEALSDYRFIGLREGQREVTVWTLLVGCAEVIASRLNL